MRGKSVGGENGTATHHKHKLNNNEEFINNMQKYYAKTTQQVFGVTHLHLHDKVVTKKNGKFPIFIKVEQNNKPGIL